MQIKMENISEMQSGESRVFAFQRNGRPAQGFLLRYREEYAAYLNQCCHWPVPLDMGDGEFFYADIDRISCKNHGATFLPLTGLCDSGPCVRAVLTGYAVEIRDGHALITVPD